MKLLEDLHNKKMQLQNKIDNPSNGKYLKFPCY